MKVLNYLEYSWLAYDLDRAKEYNDYSNYIVDLCPNCKDVIDVYSQPYKPEMLTELFKVDSNEVLKYNIYFLNNISFFYPRTLDDFINDFQRAGIELEWRKNEN